MPVLVSDDLSCRMPVLRILVIECDTLLYDILVTVSVRKEFDRSLHKLAHVLFEEGVRLSGVCSELLKNAKQKVDILIESADGIKKESFSANE